MDRNLLIRTLSGAVIVVLIVGSILLGSSVFHFLMLPIIFLGVREYFKIISLPIKDYKLGLLIIQIVGIWLVSFFVSQEILQLKSILFVVPLLSLSFILVLVKPHDFKVVQNYLVALIYIVIPLSVLVFFYSYPLNIIAEYPNISFAQDNFELLLFFLLIWAYDTFAYLVGRKLGKTQLAPTLSPKKTWEGSIGGGVITIILALVLNNYWLNIFSITETIFFALITIVFGTFGDLIESALKRKYGVKDSGTIIPGHGGILDRFDSVIFAAPFVLAYLLLLSL